MKIFFFLKATIYLVCILAFLGSAVDLYLKFSEEMTSTAIEFEDEKFLKLPAMTFCAQDPFKNKSSLFIESDFLRNTFEPEEFFSPETLETIVRIFHF